MRCAALLLAAGACHDAAAQPAAAAPAVAPAVAIPAGWQPLPALATLGDVAARAAGDARVVTRVASWGDPGTGCFATVVDITSVRALSLAAIADELRAALVTMLALDDWSITAGPRLEVSGAIARGRMHGRLRGRLVTEPAGTPHATIAACFHNDREPARCQAICGGLLASLDGPMVSP